MNKYIKLSCVAAFIIGASAAAAIYPSYSKGKIVDDYASRQDSQVKWIKTLNESNPELHDAVIATMLASKASGKEVFLLRDNKPLNKLKYKLSYERGGAENLLSYDFKQNYFSFDHYSSDDGISVATAENMIVIERKMSKFYKELSIK